MSEPFIAEVRIFAGNFAPRGWAFCNGQLLPISQNTALFSLIGTIYGGDGETTTALPNLQERAPMHPGNGPGLTSRRLGQKGGSKTVALTEAQTSAHNHSLAATPTPADSGNPVGKILASSPLGDTQFKTDPASPVDMKSDALGDQGGNAAHNNLPPYIALYFIIALTGVYPSRS